MPQAAIHFWNSRALFLGESTDTAEHQHYALQIAVGLKKPFRVRFADRWHTYQAVMIAPNHPHQFDGRGGWQIILLLEPETRLAQQLVQEYLHDGKVAAIDDRLLDGFAGEAEAGITQWTCQDARSFCEQLVSALLGTTTPQEEINLHLQKALTIIQEMPVKKASAKTIADSIHLSQSRLGYLFKKHMGIPLRRYLLWLRLLEALKQIVNGASLTMAAYDSGFSDSAHLSRTFKRMFGMTPAELFKNSQFVQVKPCLHE